MLAIGIACLVAAVVGGGVKLAGGEFPVVSSIPRQVLLGAVGMGAITISLVPGLVAGSPPPTTTTTTTTTTTEAVGPKIVELPPIADSYANQGDPGANYGNRSSLLSRGTISYISYLRFEFPPTPAGKSLTSAVLRVRTTRNEFAGSAERHSVLLADNSWTEMTINWHNSPAVGRVPVAEFEAPGLDMEVRPSLDVSKLQGPGGFEVTLAITASLSQGTDNLQIWSRNYEVGDHRPLLTLTFT